MAGDQLILADSAQPAFSLLVPNGMGRPMLGSRAGRKLRAEPSGVPASVERWRVRGDVHFVERAMEVAPAFGGDLWVAVKVEGMDGEEFAASLPSGIASDRVLADGQGVMILGHYNAIQLHRLQIAVARMLRGGISVSIGVARRRSFALALLDFIPPNRLGFGLGLRESWSRNTAPDRRVVGPLKEMKRQHSSPTRGSQVMTGRHVHWAERSVYEKSQGGRQRITRMQLSLFA